MTDPQPNDPGPPPFLVRVRNARPLPNRWGSGILVAADWVLTARHVVAEDVRNRPPLVKPGELAVWVGREVAHNLGGDDRQGRRVGSILDSGTGDDWALLQLAAPVAGIAPAALIEGVRQDDLDRLKAKSLTACGHPGADPDAVPANYPNRLVKTAGYDPQGWLTDIQLDGGLPEGMSGGALYVDGLPDRPVLGVLYLGGAGAATSRVIPAGKVLDHLRRTSHELAGRLRTLNAGELGGVKDVDEGTWDRARLVLRDLLVALPCWPLVRERKAFVEAALGTHSALNDLIWDDDGFTVAINLVSKLKFSNAVRLPDGRHGVCGLLAEVRRRQWDDANPAIAQQVGRLAAAFGCGHP